MIRLRLCVSSQALLWSAELSPQGFYLTDHAVKVAIDVACFIRAVILGEHRGLGGPQSGSRQNKKQEDRKQHLFFSCRGHCCPLERQIPIK